MKNTTFEDYWKQNQDKYIEEAKAKAKEEFIRLSTKFEASISINSHGIFTLDIPHDLQLCSDTKEQLINDVVEKLTNAKIIYHNNNTAHFGSGEQAEKYIKEYWNEMRDFVIQELKDGDEYIFVENGEEDILSVQISEIN